MMMMSLTLRVSERDRFKLQLVENPKSLGLFFFEEHFWLNNTFFSTSSDYKSKDKARAYIICLLGNPNVRPPN